MEKTDDAKVSIEAVAHRGLLDLVRRMEAEHGLVIKSVRFDWIECGTVGEMRSVVVGVEMETRLTC